MSRKYKTRKRMKMRKKSENRKIYTQYPNANSHNTQHTGMQSLDIFPFQTKYEK